MAARRTQAERREGAERGLVQAAIAVVANRGVRAATFEAIGEESGYSRSLVTQRFGSKQGLIEAVIAYLHEHLDSMLGERRIGAMSGLDAVLGYMDQFLIDLSSNGESRAYFMLLAAAVADASTLRELFAAEHERVRERLADLLERGKADGGVRPEIDASAAALMIGSLQVGLSIQMLVDPAMNLEPIRETVLATLRLSFAPQGAR
jgi:AcrR family transcriptional regulator